MSVVSQRPRRQYEVLHWGHVDLQEYANGRFVSNNNIFIIVFFNTYYHKQINKILISACNETFRQSSDPVYAHTPMRNVGGLRTFNPKLKDSAGGEVNKPTTTQVYALVSMPLHSMSIKWYHALCSRASVVMISMSFAHVFGLLIWDNSAMKALAKIVKKSSCPN